MLKFGALNFRDKKEVLKIRKLLNGKDLNGKFDNTGELLLNNGQTDNLIKYFWEPFIYAVFNTVPENVSVEIFLNVIKKGFSANQNSVLVIPEVNLNELLMNDALFYLQNKNAEINFNRKVKQIEFSEDLKTAEYVSFEDGSKISQDYIISAVPFFAFRKLFDEKPMNQKDLKLNILNQAV
ncbi:MAG: FAD-dependent oxidoreductase [Ignavibacteria bacterium]|nr:FAD-dependent oxidoreductase [Ignavibacteria bacterium]